MLRSNKKIGHFICIQKVTSSNGLEFEDELATVQPEIYPTPPNGTIWTPCLYFLIKARNMQKRIVRTKKDYFFYISIFDVRRR